MKSRKEINRATLLLVGVIFVSLWVLINSQEFLLAAFIYIVMAVVSIFLYRQWSFFGKRGKLEGIEKDWIKDAFIGVLVAVGFIVLGKFIPGVGAIGIPQVTSIASTVGRFLIICVCAPVGEELLFRELIHDFFDEKLGRVPFIVAALITSILFALFHLTAYSGSLEAASGSFFTAGLVGLGLAYLNKWTNSHASNITAHMVLNLWIGFITLNVIV